MTSRELRLRDLRRRFLLEADGDRRELLELLREGRPSGDEARRFRKLAHDLRGSGGSYGFDEVSAAAAAIEDAFLAQVAPARLVALVGELERAVGAALAGGGA